MKDDEIKELVEYAREQKCSNKVVEMIKRKPIRRTPMVDPLSATSADYRCHTWHRDSQLISVVRFIISRCHRHHLFDPLKFPHMATRMELFSSNYGSPEKAVAQDST